MKTDALRCRCCNAEGADAGLVEALRRLESKRGKALTVTSGYRCAAHNARVGGVADSAHRYGLAADIAVPEEEQEAFCSSARECGFRVVLPYPKRGFVHVALASSRELAQKRREKNGR